MGAACDPETEVRFDAIVDRDWLGSEESLDDAAQPGARELAVGEEPACLGHPKIREHVEPFTQAQLGLSIDRLLFGDRDEDNALRLAAMKLAYESYWPERRTQLPAHQGLVPLGDTWIGCTSACSCRSSRAGTSSGSRTTIQVYFAAAQLVRDNNRAAFYEAATHPRFHTASAASGATKLPEMLRFSNFVERDIVNCSSRSTTGDCEPRARDHETG